ncbi:MAG TPA: sensor histidine kinase [Nitrospiraceae bacterium]|nr:sensor histidine kinase [Nitrospiraceae bacterium]
MIENWLEPLLKTLSEIVIPLDLALNLAVLPNLVAVTAITFLLYRRPCFAYFALGWLVNVVTIIIFNRPSLKDTFTYELVHSAVSMTASLLFRIAYLDLKERRLATLLYGWRPALFVGITVVCWGLGLLLSLPATFMPQSSILDFLRTIPTGKVTVLPAIALTIGVMFDLGKWFNDQRETKLLSIMRGRTTLLTAWIADIPDEVLRQVRESEILPAAQRTLKTLNTARHLLAWSFIFYAAIHIFYLIPLGFDPNRVVPFFLAIGIKVGILLGMILILYADFLDLGRQLRISSELAVLGAVTAGVEHDMRHSLGLLSYSVLNLRRSALRKDADLTAKDPLGEINDIHDELMRLEATLDAIPTLRADAELRRSVVGVGGAVRQAANQLGLKGNAQIALHYDGHEGDLFTFADQEWLHYMFTNVLRNAKEAITSQWPRGGGEIGITFARIEGNAQVAIRDNGGGIPESILPHVRSPYVSSKTGGRRNRGMGLFIASRLAERQGGSLTIDTDSSSYTIVTISMPLQSADTPPPVEQRGRRRKR